MNPSPQTHQSTSLSLGSTDVVDDLVHAIAGATHTIVGYADLLEASDVDSVVAHHLDPIRQIAQRLNRLADCVALCATEELVPVETVNLDAVVDALIERRAADLSTRGAEVKSRLGNVPAVLVDLERLDRALDVVVDHALGHGPRGLSFVASADVDRSHVMLSISVTGIDFDRLTRRLVVHLARRAGADAAFERRADGPVVEIRFPRVVNDEDTIPTLTVLHIDDDAATRELVEAILKTASVVVIAASDLTEARHLLAEEAVDLLLVDQRLGDERGIELVRSVRAHPDHESLPVVVLSAENAPDFEREVAALGAEILHKPVSNDELVAVIQRTMSAYY